VGGCVVISHSLSLSRCFPPLVLETFQERKKGATMADIAAPHQFGNILLGGRGGTNPGQLRINPVGFYWRKIGGGKEVEVPKNEISSLSWTRVPKGYQLGVKLKAGQDVKFNGFREQVAMVINILLFLLH
jgi:hypothetical protein